MINKHVCVFYFNPSCFVLVFFLNSFYFLQVAARVKCSSTVFQENPVSRARTHSRCTLTQMKLFSQNTSVFVYADWPAMLIVRNPGNFFTICIDRTARTCRECQALPQQEEHNNPLLLCFQFFFFSAAAFIHCHAIVEAA